MANTTPWPSASRTSALDFNEAFKHKPALCVGLNGEKGSGTADAAPAFTAERSQTAYTTGFCLLPYVFQ